MNDHAVFAAVNAAFDTAHAILVLNAGSSSLKFAVYATRPASDTLRPIARGHVARVAACIEWQVADGGGHAIEATVTPCAGDGFDHDLAMTQVLDWVDAHPQGCRSRPSATGWCMVVRRARRRWS